MSQQHSPENNQEPPPTSRETLVNGDSGPSGDFELWMAWISETASTGSTFAELLAAEVRLALGDAGRLLMLALLSLPVVLLAWLGLTSLIAWLLGSASDSVSVGLLAFLLQQCTLLAVMGWLWKRYKRSLSLPLTRQHWQAFTGGMRQHETQTPDP